jgi:hypothetical protein
MTTWLFNLSRSEMDHDQRISRYVITPTVKNGAIVISILSLILLIPRSAPGGTTSHPKYLVPVNPNERAYEQAIETLLHGRQGRGTMIYTESPYAEGDFVISAWGKDRSDRDGDHAINNFLTLIKVSPGKPDEAIPRAEIEIPIDMQLATSIEKAWTNVLLKTRYPPGPYLGLDGWQVEFSVFVRRIGTLYGQLWSPSKGVTKELMDLGFALSKYVEASEQERVLMRSKLMQRLDEIGTRKLDETR